MSTTASPHSAARVEVLIVDDNQPDVFLTRMAIGGEYAHCDFHVADTGKAAFGFLRREPPYENAVIPDIVILDLNLPFRSGEEVLDLIRSTEHLRDITVVLCSSSPRDLRLTGGDAPDITIAKPMGLDSYLAMGKQIMQCFWRKKGQTGSLRSA